MQSIAQPVVPAAICRLDVILNKRIADAATEREQIHWWQVKLTIKRRLATLPDDQIDDEANEAISSLLEIAQ
jgi:hypothetical protein